jgi:hypothetical protein
MNESAKRAGKNKEKVRKKTVESLTCRCRCCKRLFGSSRKHDCHTASPTDRFRVFPPARRASQWRLSRRWRRSTSASSTSCRRAPTCAATAPPTGTPRSRSGRSAAARCLCVLVCSCLRTSDLRLCTPKGRLKVLSKGDTCVVQLIDAKSGELFAVCPVTRSMHGREQQCRCCD